MLPAFSKITKSIFSLSLPTWINAVIGIIAVPIVTRLFEPDILGKIYLFFTYVTILSSISLAGMNQGLLRFFNEPPGKNSSGGLFWVCFSIVIFFSSLWSLLVLFFGKDFFQSLSDSNQKLVFFCMIISASALAISNLINSVNLMQNKLIKYGMLTILLNLCAKISYAGSIFFLDKFAGSIIIVSSVYVSVTILFLYDSKINFRSERPIFGINEVIPLLKYSLPFMPVLFIAQINTALPKLLISKYLDYSQVGVYSAAFSVVSIISIVQSGINVFWAPFVFKNFSKNSKMLSSAHLLVSFLMIFIGLVIVLFQDLIYIAIGPQYRESQKFFALLLVSPICYTISETSGIGINISKKTYLNIVVYSITLGFTYLLGLLCIPSMGLLGAAISVAIASYCMLIVKTILGEKFYKMLKCPLKTFGSPAIFILIISMNTYFFYNLLLRTTIILIGIAIICFIHFSELNMMKKNLFR